MGGVIVFVAIITAIFASKFYPNATSSSLVALAINYTLLIPIYLNWVVKLFSDMEMYVGAVERVASYIDGIDNIDVNGIAGRCGEHNYCNVDDTESSRNGSDIEQRETKRSSTKRFLRLEPRENCKSTEFSL